VTSARNGEQLACAELAGVIAKQCFGVCFEDYANLDALKMFSRTSWMRAFTHIGTLMGGQPFSTWVTRIAINSALGMIEERRHKEFFAG